MQLQGKALRQCTGKSILAAGRFKRAFSSVRPHPSFKAHSATVFSVQATAAEDKWIAKSVLPLTQQPAAAHLQGLRESCTSALSTLRMPTTRNEEYRFTDITPLLKTTLQPAASDAPVSKDQIQQCIIEEAANSYIVLVNGTLRPDLSNLSAVPAGIYVGSISQAPAEAITQLGAQSSTRGGPFSVINGAAATDALCVHIPPATHLTAPLHLIHIQTSGTTDATPASAPRVLLLAGSESSCELIEEFITSDSAAAAAASNSSSPSSFSCAVAELLLGEGAAVKHAYVERQAAGAVAVKSTLVSQAARSDYQLVEARVGGSLTRHDLGIVQFGEETHTSMRHFLLCGEAQLSDLHSKLTLDHPRGAADQLHKCIVTAASGRGVFDGNVKVNRLAQKTDAGQLSRNLLLVPRATVNVKPNLQIIADDVKCTHGCAVSDLSEEELFYFRARGIDQTSARQALVYSFGAEVVGQLRYKGLQQRLQRDVARALSGVPTGAASS